MGSDGQTRGPRDPATEWVSRAELIRWLGAYGLTRWNVSQQIEQGMLTARVFPGCKRRKYHWRSVKRELQLELQDGA